MANIYAMSDTWNASGTTFTAIKMDVDDQASASGSLLMDLQVAGASKFSVSKLGNISFRGHDITSDATAMVLTNASGVRSLITRSDYSLVPEASFFGWGNLTSFNSDLRLYRDAANTLGQRNSTNAQTFNIYNTYTDASNYERGFMKWNTNVLEIGAEAAGTGSNREVVIKQAGQNRVTVGTNFTVANGVSNVFLDSATYFAATTSAASRAYAGNGFKVGSAYTYDFSSTTSAAGTADAGIKRAAAGQLQITNGSTGTGELIFIVPTSDPGITGALWNNAGTLSISA